MQHKTHTPFTTRIVEAIAIIACLLYAIGAISQQPAAATATYRTHGPAILNDLTVTPGAAGTTPQATLCSPSFHTGAVRNVPESLKQRVCRNYGIARADCTGQKVEIDHLISLELGGTNDEANLWPQPYFPKPAAKEKDIVENWLHRQVCSNAIPLAQAQHEIATDWYQVYLDLNAPPAASQAKAFRPAFGDSVMCGKGADCRAFFLGVNDGALEPGRRIAAGMIYHLHLDYYLHAPDLIGAAR